MYGTISVNNEELDDLIISRSDGNPTYNFTVVVDDWEMKITHVIRGDDHINNTPRQINILTALGADIPIYAHLPMILGDDGKRLSKRHGAVSVLEFRDMGILPDALINYIARLGWSHGDQEIFSKQELINYFDLRNISKGSAAFNTEKLLWLNQQYLKAKPPAELVSELEWHFAKENVSTANGPNLEEVIALQVDRCKTLAEMAEKSRYFYHDAIEYDPVARIAHLSKESLPVLQSIHDGLAALDDWQDAAIHAVIDNTATQLNLKMGKVAQPLRVALTGNTMSPSIDKTVRLIGKTQTVQRLQNVIALIQEDA